MKKDLIASLYESIDELEALVDLHHRELVKGKETQDTKVSLLQKWNDLEYGTRSAIVLLGEQDFEKKKLQLNRIATIRRLIKNMQR